MFVFIFECTLKKRKKSFSEFPENRSSQFVSEPSHSNNGTTQIKINFGHHLLLLPSNPKAKLRCWFYRMKQINKF